MKKCHIERKKFAWFKKRISFTGKITKMITSFHNGNWWWWRKPGPPA